jgi:hypothetical protein
MSSTYYSILEKDGLTKDLSPQEKQKLKLWARNQEQIFNIFIIFIINQKKEYIIPELLKLQSDGYNFSPYNDPEIFYYTFKPYIEPLGKIYFSNIKYSNDNNNNTEEEFTRKVRLTKKNKYKTHKIKTKTKNSTKNTKNTKGGFLFMLEDKGKEPITGDDIKNVLDKYSEAINILQYTQFARDSSVGSGEGDADLANPFTGLSVIMNLSRKRIQPAAYTLMPRISTLLSDPMDWTDYYSLYNLYKREYDDSERRAYEKAMKLIKEKKPDESIMMMKPVEP